MHEPYALHGIVPALITPLHADESLDIESLETLIEFQMSAGVHGLFIAGMTGEGAALPQETLRSLIRHTLRIVAGRIPVCAGILENGAARTIETANRLADEGVELFSTTVPYAPPAPCQEEILRHFEWICENTNARWMVYGNAGSFVSIAPQTMRQLAELPGICAIKDTRPDYEGLLKNIMAVRGTGVSLLCGGEYLVGPGLLMGAQGNISGATNLAPGLFCRLYEAAMAGDVEGVRTRTEQIALLHGISRGIDACWLSAFKYAGQRMGLMQPHCMAPSQLLTEAHKRHIDQVLERLDLNL